MKIKSHSFFIKISRTVIVIFTNLLSSIFDFFNNTKFFQNVFPDKFHKGFIIPSFEV